MCMYIVEKVRAKNDIKSPIQIMYQAGIMILQLTPDIMTLELQRLLKVLVRLRGETVTSDLGADTSDTDHWPLITATDECCAGRCQTSFMHLPAKLRTDFFIFISDCVRESGVSSLTWECRVCVRIWQVGQDQPETEHGNGLTWSGEVWTLSTVEIDHLGTMSGNFAIDMKSTTNAK